MRTLVKMAAAVVLVGAGAWAAAPAQAAGPHEGFGQHVVMCAQEMGFSGTNNPGVHHSGASGWHDMEHSCSM